MPANHQPEKSTPKRRRGGAPAGNSNAIKSGRYSRKCRFSAWRGISRDRPDLADDEAVCESLLSQLESAVLKARPGEMTLEDASAADVAVGAEFVCRLARRHILSGALEPALEVAFAKDVLAAKQVRHRYIKILDLNVRKEDPDAPQAVYAKLAEARQVKAAEESQEVAP